jgi:uncharacterized RDD family membrane protein YckC
VAHSGSGDVVTGEAVVLDLRLARLASRSLALAIDLVVQGLLLVVGTFVVAGAISVVDDALAAAIGLVFYLAVIVGYPVAWESLTRGRSLGKLAMGLRVVREDGGPIRFRHAFVRALLGVIEIWASFGSIALIASLASAQGRRLGDFLAGTVVVHERLPVRAAPVAAMPPQLAGWAAGLDLSRVPDGLALEARQFLGRAHELSPEVREQMGTSIARALAQVVAPPPPPGVPAWAFVAAVLAERRRRESARLATGSWYGSAPAPQPVTPWQQPPAPAPYPSVPAPQQQPTSPPAPQQQPTSPPTPPAPDGPFAPPS